MRSFRYTVGVYAGFLTVSIEMRPLPPLWDCVLRVLGSTMRQRTTMGMRRTLMPATASIIGLPRHAASGRQEDQGRKEQRQKGQGRKERVGKKQGRKEKG